MKRQDWIEHKVEWMPTKAYRCKDCHEKILVNWSPGMLRWKWMCEGCNKYEKFEHEKEHYPDWIYIPNEQKTKKKKRCNKQQRNESV